MTIIKNASQILTLAGNDLGVIEKSSIVINANKISDIRFPTSDIQHQKTIDATNCVVMPGYVDCHTHLVFAGSRENEFAMRLEPRPSNKGNEKFKDVKKCRTETQNEEWGEGKTYKEILTTGGGILQTVNETRKSSANELFNLAQKRIDKLIQWGTTTVEIKSGYGLNTPTELKILRVIKRLQKANKNRITIVPTFLGAHAIPSNVRKTTYIKKLISEMIPLVAKENLAQFCDVFCENFVFDAKESKKILKRAKKFCLVPKIHADEIESSGGAEVAGEVKAISAEHLLYPSNQGLIAMNNNNVTAVLLPGTTLFLKSKQIPPIDKMRKLGLTIALGSDYNPGTCMIYQMPIIIALGCLLYNMSITEAIRGATINGAKALGLDKKIGTIEVGKNADILILDIPDYKHIPYQFGKNLVKTVIKNGDVIYSRNVNL